MPILVATMALICSTGFDPPCCWWGSFGLSVCYFLHSHGSRMEGVMVEDEMMIRRIQSDWRKSRFLIDICNRNHGSGRERSEGRHLLLMHRKTMMVASESESDTVRRVERRRSGRSVSVLLASMGPPHFNPIAAKGKVDGGRSNLCSKTPTCKNCNKHLSEWFWQEILWELIIILIIHSPSISLTQEAIISSLE